METPSKPYVSQKDEEFKRNQRAVPDQELLDLARKQLSEFCKDHRKFTMTVPPRIDDNDMVIGELITRLQKRVDKDKKTMTTFDYLEAGVTVLAYDPDDKKWNRSRCTSVDEEKAHFELYGDEDEKWFDMKQEVNDSSLYRLVTTIS